MQMLHVQALNVWNTLPSFSKSQSQTWMAIKSGLTTMLSWPPLKHNFKEIQTISLGCGGENTLMLFILGFLVGWKLKMLGCLDPPRTLLPWDCTGWWHLVGWKLKNKNENCSRWKKAGRFQPEQFFFFFLFYSMLDSCPEWNVLVIPSRAIWNWRLGCVPLLVCHVPEFLE